MSYPTDREVIRELIDTANNSFERGYELGKQVGKQEILNMVIDMLTKDFQGIEDFTIKIAHIQYQEEEKNKCLNI